MRPRLGTAYHQHRTDTGRLSSGEDGSDKEKLGRGEKRIQVQNWPKELRDIVSADPGFVFVGGDWAAIQWALCMYLADNGDGFHADLLDRQQRGELDPHSYLAGFFRGPLDDPKLARQLAKPYTYGKMFYGRDETIGRQVGHSLALSRKVGQAYEPAFRLSDWWHRESEEVARTRYVETPDGFRKYYFDTIQWDDERFVLKSPRPQEYLAVKIQGAEAGLLKYCARSFLTAPSWVEWITTTYDSLVIQVPEDKAEDGKGWLTGVMGQPVPFLDGRSWRCEVKVGLNWGEVS